MTGHDTQATQKQKYIRGQDIQAFSKHFQKIMTIIFHTVSADLPPSRYCLCLENCLWTYIFLSYKAVLYIHMYIMPCNKSSVGG